MADIKTNNNCSLLRRLSAMLYDSLLLTAVLFISTLLLMPFVGGEAIHSGNIFYKIYLLFIGYLYFCWHWVTGGQTLGMRSWNIQVVNDSEKMPDWKQSSLRYIYSLLSLILFGLGFIWSLFDKNKLALHDHLSKTKLIVNKS